MVHLADGLSLRQLRLADHPVVLDAVRTWWNTPNADQLGSLLPRLFFQHFTDTSWVLEDANHTVRAFVIAFRSQSDPDDAYIHFTGVDPSLRRTGTASSLYEHVFAQFRAAGCTRVQCITGPPNTTSQAFHTALGFAMLPGDRTEGGVPVWSDYDGPGQHRVVFARDL